MSFKALSISIIALGLLAISIGFNIRQASQLDYLRWQAPVYDEDQPYIDKAAALWAVSANEPKGQVMKGRYAVSVHLENETCIELRVIGLGGEPTYCFRNSDGTLLRKHDQVD